MNFFHKRTATYRRTGACLLAAALLTACAPKEAPQTDLIPKPASLEYDGGWFDADSSVAAGNFSDPRIVCILDSAVGLGPEGYELIVRKNGVQLRSASEQGLFYGKQTLRQLLTPAGIPCLTMRDEPRFPYRGIHLDVSRHFFPKENVFKLLDEMAYYKLNTFHFHLTDNGGWRIRLDSYPKLTSEGSFRTKSSWPEWFWMRHDGKFVSEGTPNAYGGYYTKEEIREILDYAKERHITVIPEIEFPGHSEEVFVGYPELCCGGKPYTGGEFCIGNPETFTFMERVLDEIIELFPSEYIHIGGDEVQHKAWKSCPKCQALMKREGMQNEDELQCYLVEHADRFLQSRGRKLMGWDEILKSDLSDDAVVMSYRGEAGGIRAAKQGYKAIMTPGEILYFDWFQADPKTQPRGMDGYSPIKKMYSFEPAPTDSLTAARNETLVWSKPSPAKEWLTPEESERVIGVQGCAWTELIEAPDHLEYMIYPRLLAIAELGWTPKEERCWDDFKPRMNRHIPQLHLRGINAFPLSWNVDITSLADSANGTVQVMLDAERFPAEIRYTTDGSEPSATSPLYEEPFTLAVQDSALIKAAIFQNGTLQKPISERSIDSRTDRGLYYEYHPAPQQ